MPNVSDTGRGCSLRMVTLAGITNMFNLQPPIDLDWHRFTQNFQQHR